MTSCSLRFDVGFIMTTSSIALPSTLFPLHLFFCIPTLINSPHSHSSKRITSPFSLTMSPTTRRSARLANSSPTKDDAAAGTKRKADSDDFKGSKRGRKAVPKKQSTIEESIGNGQEDVTSKDSMDPKEGDNTSAGGEAFKDEADDKNRQDEPAEQVGGENETKKHDSPVENEHKPYNGDAKTSADANDTIQKSAEREKKMPSNILEKGILYFLTRNRVGIEEPESVGDLQRTYFVLRPLPNGAKLGDGAIPDSKTNRLLALPKKTLPQSHRDRFMAFVEKTNVSIQDLKEEFFQGKEYETKTMGTRHIEPVTPIGEGVYAITRAEDQSTHLAYMLTIPAEIGEVQQDLGLRSQGSFHISVKNPERPGPAAARLPEGPDFPKE